MSTARILDTKDLEARVQQMYSDVAENPHQEFHHRHRHDRRTTRQGHRPGHRGRLALSDIVTAVALPEGIICDAARSTSDEPMRPPKSVL